MNFGNVPNEIDSRDYPFVRHEHTLQIPMTFDLQAYFDEPFEQSDGTDTECAVSAVAEYYLRRRGQNFRRIEPVTGATKTIRDCLKAQRENIGRYERIQGITQVLEAISQWQPVIVGMQYFGSFKPPDPNIVLPSDGEQPLGNMSAVIVGFDQYKQQLTVMHSLGKENGVYGHFYVPFTYEPFIHDLWAVRG